MTAPTIEAAYAMGQTGSPARTVNEREVCKECFWRVETMTVLHEVKVCKWSEDQDSVWDTQCDNRFVFNSDGPADNGFEYCPYCGNKIKEQFYGRN